jgi:hypothetical protein
MPRAKIAAPEKSVQVFPPAIVQKTNMAFEKLVSNQNLE